MTTHALGIRPLLVGGASLVQLKHGRWATKRPFAEYLAEMGSLFGRVAFVGPASPWAYESVDIPSTVSAYTYSSGWLGRFALILQVARLADRNSPILLHYPNSLPLLPVLPLLKKRTNRLVVYLANSYKQDAVTHHSSRVRSKLYLHGYEAAIRQADAVIARGRYVASLARQLNPTVFETVPVGDLHLNRTPFQKDPDATSHRILYIGKLAEGKGVKQLLQAIGRLNEHPTSKPVRLDVAGDGIHQKQLVEYASSIGVADSVCFHGYVSNKSRMDALWGRAALVVVPSVHPEGVPRVIDESISRGIPVVATKVGGVAKEFTSSEVLLVAPGSVEELVTAISRGLLDPEQRSRVAALALHRVNRWRQEGSAGQQHARILLGSNKRLDNPQPD